MSVATQEDTLRVRLRRRVSKVLVTAFFRGLTALGKLHPRANPSRHGVEVLCDIPYLPSGLREHRLDVYRPRKRSGPLPCVLFIHGGGFRILSKDSHWMMGLAFAKRGFVVFNISYRLAPEHPYPAAVEDCCSALQWVAEHGAAYGADLEQLVFAGESAGANLASALTIAACYRRPEPFAQKVFALGLLPRVVLAVCGLLQVSDSGRFARRKKLPTWLQDRIFEVERGYLPLEMQGGALPTLADPLLVFEDPELRPERPLPAFFLPVGTKDPIMDDTRRMARALNERGVDNQLLFYKDEVHAFYAMIWRPRARQCWRDIFAFLKPRLAARAPASR